MILLCALVFALWTTEKNEISLANKFAFDDIPSARSFKHIKNSRWLSMKPWGTPAFKLHFKGYQICHCFSLKIIPSCHTLSKALHMSRYTLRTSKLSSKDWYLSWVIDQSWLMQESPGLKPDWLWDIRSFSIKNPNNPLNIHHSRILLHTGSKDIGR